MAAFVEVKTKGLDGCWLEASLDPDRLRLHLSELAAGARPHPPHTHGGVEAFYVLEGAGLIETESGAIPVQANQAVILDASRSHTLMNTGSGPLK